MRKGLFVGKSFDPASARIGDRIEIDSSDLLTHGLIVGMTGSGKTGLACALIEEVLRQGVPVLAIDPKGDLGNLLLLFESWDAMTLSPWIDPEAAKREGKTVEAFAQETAKLWSSGWKDWGLTPADAGELKRAREALIFTPGSSAGVALNILQSLAAPSVPFDSMAEELRDEIASLVRGLMGLARMGGDPVQSKAGVFLANLIEKAWREKRDLTLEALIAEVADPPLEKIGALPLERVYPQKEREELLIALNNVLAAPAFEYWRKGQPLDIEQLLRAPDGRPRLSIVSTAHLADEERFFITALLLDRIKTWMRRQSGTSELRALVYMDEIYGYFPPHPADPPTKRPLITLLKQARAQGVGVVLATQNPVDIDYKGLANMGMWLVGRLQTEQDRDRLRDGLIGAGADAKTIDTLLGATRKRVFLLHDVHRKEPCLLHSRFTFSYLRGPLTREEISRLMADKAQSIQTPAESRATAGAGASKSDSTARSAPPSLPAPLQHSFLKRYGAEIAEPHVFVKFAVRYKDLGERVLMRAYALGGATPAEALESEPVDIDESALSEAAPEKVRYADLPEYLHAQGAKGLERAFKDRLPAKLAVKAFVDPVTRETSLPGEDRDTFAKRLGADVSDPQREKIADKIAKKKSDLEARERDLSGRRTEKWAAIGGAIISNLGWLTGRKRSVSGAGAVLSKNRMENTAEARVEALRAEITNLEEDLKRLEDVDPARFEEREIIPASGGVKLLRYDIVWIY